MTALLTTICIDCRDAALLAAFWSEVLGWSITDVDEDDGAIVVGGGAGVLPVLLFIPVPEDKTVKNRIHLDINPLGTDQPEELGRLLALGATEIDIGQGDVRWHVLADPEGNEFCLLRTRHD